MKDSGMEIVIVGQSNWCSGPLESPAWRKTTLHKQHGEREKSRRLRQIFDGRLQVSNGLENLNWEEML